MCVNPLVLGNSTAVKRGSTGAAISMFATRAGREGRELGAPAAGLWGRSAMGAARGAATTEAVTEHRMAPQCSLPFPALPSSRTRDPCVPEAELFGVIQRDVEISIQNIVGGICLAIMI